MRAWWSSGWSSRSRASNGFATIPAGPTSAVARSSCWSARASPDEGHVLDVVAAPGQNPTTPINDRPRTRPPPPTIRPPPRPTVDGTPHAARASLADRAYPVVRAGHPPCGGGGAAKPVRPGAQGRGVVRAGDADPPAGRDRPRLRPASPSALLRGRAALRRLRRGGLPP